ncbi:hypothetical protein OQA88_828 [Cercophora sp. LCS_1]
MLSGREARASSASAYPPLPPGFDPEVYLSVFSWLCSALRMYVRLVIQRAPGWDDAFTLLALLCTSMSSVLLCIGPDYGLGRSLYTLTFSEIERLIKIIYIGGFPYPLSVVFIKLALLFQYLRIFKPGSRQAVLCTCMSVIVAIWGSIFAVITWIPCVPLQGYWDFSVANARCWGLGSHDWDEFMRYFVGQAITTAVLDFVVFTIPAQLYFKSATQRKTRIALLCLFGLGLCVNVCSLWRMAYVIQLQRAGRSSFDPTWFSPTATGLANIEVHLAVACAGLPIFWPDLEKTWGRIFVTQEVSVTADYGQFPSRPKDVELQSISSGKNPTLDPAQMADGWEPFVGDETTGLGESETVIEAAARVNKRTSLGLFSMRIRMLHRA